MTILNKTIHSGSTMVIRQGLGAVIGLASILFVTRIIGPKAYGSYITSFTILSFLTLTSQLGSLVFLLRQDSNMRWFADNISTLILLISSLCAFGLFSMSNYISVKLGNPDLHLLLIYSSFLMPILTITIVPQAILEKDLRYREIAQVELLGQIMFVLVSSILAFAHFRQFAPFLGLTVQTIFIYLSFSRIGNYFIKLTWSKPVILEVLRHASGYSASIWVWQLRSLINPILVGYLLGAEAVGVVAIGIRFVEMLSFAKGSIYRVAQSALGKLRGNRLGFNNIVNFGMAFQLVAVWLPLCVFSYLGEYVIRSFFSSKWLESLSIYNFVAISYLWNAFFSLYSSALYLERDNKTVTYFHIFNVLSLGLGAYVLCSGSGVRGYGIAELTTLLSYTILVYGYHRRFHVLPDIALVILLIILSLSLVNVVLLEIGFAAIICFFIPRSSRERFIGVVKSMRTSI